MKPETLNPTVLKALAVTAKVMGTTLDEDAARMFAQDLARYPAQQVLDALTRCRREVKGRLTLADVIGRLEDGRPGVEEAWAMLPKDEYRSVVWCEEMAKAYGVCAPLLESDPVGARMAFKEAYSQALQLARSAGIPVKWSTSFGFDVPGRAAAIREAADRNRLSHDEANRLIEKVAPEYNSARLLDGPQGIAGLLTSAVEKTDQAKARALIATIRKALT